jgi:ADP-ribosylglycohydrolase
MFYANQPENAIERSGESSRTTHGAQAAVDACRYFAGLLIGALRGDEKSDLLSRRYSPLSDYWDEHPLIQSIDEIACGSFKVKRPPEIRGSGYVVKTLEAALWAFYRSESFEEGCLLAVNLGEDADTTGAIFGQLAGAHYGVSGIPERWLSRLAERAKIMLFADQLYHFTQIE